MEEHGAWSKLTPDPAFISHLFTVGRAAAGSPLELDTTRLVDGFHELTVVAIGSDKIESQGRRAIGVRVDNHQRQVTLTTAEPKSAYGRTLKLELKASEGATQIRLNEAALAQALAALESIRARVASEHGHAA